VSAIPDGWIRTEDTGSNHHQRCIRQIVVVPVDNCRLWTKRYPHRRVATALARLRIRSTMTMFRALPRTTAASAYAQPTLPAPTIRIFMIKYPFARRCTVSRAPYRQATLTTASDEIRQGCVNTSNPSARAMAARVMPAASAMRTASPVGAETDTITGEPMAVLFCTISTDIRLVRSMIPSLTTVCVRRPRCAPRHHHGAGIRKPSHKRTSPPTPIIGGCGDEKPTILADANAPCGKGHDSSQRMDQVSASLTCPSKKKDSRRFRCQRGNA